jgi:cation transport regulator ChaB
MPGKKVHDNAVDEYGEGEKAHRTAWAALKKDFKKKGDKWVKR